MKSVHCSHYSILYSQGDPKFHMFTFCPKIYELVIPIYILRWHHALNIYQDIFFVLWGRLIVVVVHCIDVEGSNLH